MKSNTKIIMFIIGLIICISLYAAHDEDKHTDTNPTVNINTQVDSGEIPLVYSDYDLYTQSAKTTLCPTCNGTGKVKCKSCGGLGYSTHTEYPIDLGVGTVTPYETKKRCCLCNGSGMSMCFHCGGTGKL